MMMVALITEMLGKQYEFIYHQLSMFEDVNSYLLVSEYVSKFVTRFCKVTEQTDLLGKFTKIIHAGCEFSLYKPATTVFSHPSNKI